MSTATMSMPMASPSGHVNMSLLTDNLVLLNQPVFFMEIRSSEYPTSYIPISSLLLAGSTQACSSYIISCIRSSMYSLDRPTCEYMGRCIASFACWVVRSYRVRGFYILVEVDMIGSDDGRKIEEEEEEEKMIGSDVGGGELDGEVCAVCLDELSGRIEIAGLPCSHVFHQRCIHSWIGYKNSCPLCRCPIYD